MNFIVWDFSYLFVLLDLKWGWFLIQFVLAFHLYLYLQGLGVMVRACGLFVKLSNDKNKSNADSSSFG